MGKITGFLEIDRQERKYAPASDRVRNYREFAIPLSEKKWFSKYQLLYKLKAQSPILETSVNAAIAVFPALLKRSTESVKNTLRMSR